MQSHALDPAAMTTQETGESLLLEATGVTKQFEGLVANRDIDFNIPRHSIVSIIGPNGAGKTTFFNQITGIFAPTAGKITLDGVDITGFPRTRSLSWGSPARTRTSGSSRT